MNKLLFLPFLFALGCGPIPEPTQAPTPGFPPAERTVSQIPVTTNCVVSYNSLTETDFKCTFHNGSYTVSSLCINVSMIQHWQKEFAMSLHPFCSGGIAPHEDRTVTYTVRSLEHTKLSHSCGRDLVTCYMRIDPVKVERILP